MRNSPRAAGCSPKAIQRPAIWLQTFDFKTIARLSKLSIQTSAIWLDFKTIARLSIYLTFTLANKIAFRTSKGRERGLDNCSAGRRGMSIAFAAKQVN